MHHVTRISLLGFMTIAVAACASPSHKLGAESHAAAYQVTGKAGQDITNMTLTKRSNHCVDYVGQYHAIAEDDHNHQHYTAYLTISTLGDKCVFTSNAIPNHTYNDGKRSLPNDVKPQYQVYQITRLPTFAAQTTPLSLRQDNAIFLNGVKVDVLAAGCYGVGDGRIGCNNMNQPWRYDPIYRLSMFATDSHHAHAQPDGTYHYHAAPNALFSEHGHAPSPVIGFAADGFPIFGSLIDDDGTIRPVTSSYQLRTGSRPSGAGNPGGQYDGRFRDDYIYMKNSGDLDECNGMTVNGVYGYYITATFPYILNCFKGTPDPSFNKKRPEHQRHHHPRPSQRRPW
ncbi:YHYH protein [Piscirickettsia salmonis]|uniref:YHYH protein n=1 Tax=Piscirickettsia salmonis TaxID=1238 RepID=UPI003751FAB4